MVDTPVKVDSVTVEASPRCTHKFTVNPSVIEVGQGWKLSFTITCPLCGVKFETLDGNRNVSDNAWIAFAEPGVLKGNVKTAPPAQPVLAKSAEKPKPAEPKPVGDPRKGLPGTKMLSLTPEFGIAKKIGCSCENTARTMDKLGVEGCRRRANMLIMEIEGEWEKWEWKDKLLSAPKAVWKSLGLGIKPTDPVPDLFNLSVDLAEQDAQALAAETPETAQ